MAKANKYQYRIQYIDNTYQMVEWTKAELKSVGDAMIKNDPAVMVGDDIYRTSDIRAIVYLPPIPELSEAEKKAMEEKAAMEEWGFVDRQTAEWLKMQGIKMGGAN